MRDKVEIEGEIGEIERQMGLPGFWDDKIEAQDAVKRHQDLKDELAGVGKYDKRNAIVTIIAGAGGLDSEDFAKIIYHMYIKYAEDNGHGAKLLHEHENEHGGYKNVSFEIEGSGVYGKLKHESGVHRLVRLSPFNANQKRHTSFVMVEVVPEMAGMREIELEEDDLKIEYSKSSGPGGQNANKRETSVRVVHIPTGIAVHCESERSQHANKERAYDILRGKLHKLEEDNRKREAEGLSATKSTEIEWGNQIRSYVFHPYQMVKDHRTGVEMNDISKVLSGEIDKFLEAERDL